MRLVAIFFGLAVLSAGCGAGGSSSSGTGGGSSVLVAKVQHAKAAIEHGKLVASAEISEGGKPGERLTLRYGLVDAVSGVRASEEEQLVGRYTTEASVKRFVASVDAPKPATPTDYLLHFVLYAPDGSYLASADSPVFTVS